MSKPSEHIELTDRELYLDDLIEAELAYLNGDAQHPAEAEPGDIEAQGILWTVDLLRLNATGRIPKRPPPWGGPETWREAFGSRVAALWTNHSEA